MSDTKLDLEIVRFVAAPRESLAGLEQSGHSQAVVVPETMGHGGARLRFPQWRRISYLHERS